MQARRPSGLVSGYFLLSLLLTLMNPTINVPAPTIRQQATTLAWQIVRTARLPFKTAQNQAWATVKLLTRMQSGPTQFAYIKDDRTRRVAIGERPAPATDKPLVVRYFDVEAGS